MTDEAFDVVVGSKSRNRSSQPIPIHGKRLWSRQPFIQDIKSLLHLIEFQIGVIDCCENPPPDKASPKLQMALPGQDISLVAVHASENAMKKQ